MKEKIYKAAEDFAAGELTNKVVGFFFDSANWITTLATTSTLNEDENKYIIGEMFKKGPQENLEELLEEHKSSNTKPSP